MSRALLGLMAGLVIELSAFSASGAFFGVIDLGGNTYEVTLNGEAGDAATTLVDVTVNEIEIFGATLISQDPSSSIFFGKVLGANNLIVAPTLLQVTGVDAFTAGAFDSSSALPLGQFTLSGVPTDIRLGGTGLFAANPEFADPPIHISQSGGESLLAPEPGSAVLLALGLAAFLSRQRKRSRFTEARLAG